MYSKKVVIKNGSGLHSRPAADISLEATKYISDVTIKNLEKELKANAKSMLSILTARIKKGDEIEIVAEGEDEILAVDSLVDLVEGGFGEL